MEAVTKVIRTFGNIFCYLVVKPFVKFCWTITKFCLVLSITIGIFAGIMRLVSFQIIHIVENIVVSQKQSPPDEKEKGVPGRPSHYSSPPTDVEYNYELNTDNGSFPNVVEIPSILSDVGMKKGHRISNPINERKSK